MASCSNEIHFKMIIFLISHFASVLSLFCNTLDVFRREKCANCVDFAWTGNCCFDNQVEIRGISMIKSNLRSSVLDGIFSAFSIIDFHPWIFKDSNSYDHFLQTSKSFGFGELT